MYIINIYIYMLFKKHIPLGTSLNHPYSLNSRERKTTKERRERERLNFLQDR